MNKPFAALLIGATVVSGTPALAQHRHGHAVYVGGHNAVVRYYGGPYGYGGYAGPWRTGQRYPYYANSQYVIYNYGAYGLPAPWPGYHYYHTDSGDIVMAAIASGIIGLIIGSAIGGHPYYPPAPVPVPVPPPAPVPVPVPAPPPGYYPPGYYPPPYYPPGPYYPRPYGY